MCSRSMTSPGQRGRHQDRVQQLAERLANVIGARRRACREPRASARASAAPASAGSTPTTRSRGRCCTSPARCGQRRRQRRLTHWHPHRSPLATLLPLIPLFPWSLRQLLPSGETSRSGESWVQLTGFGRRPATWDGGRRADRHENAGRAARRGHGDGAAAVLRLRRQARGPGATRGAAGSVIGPATCACARGGRAAGNVAAPTSCCPTGCCCAGSTGSR